MELVFIDTHAHIYLDQFSDDLDLVLERCRELGIDRILMPNIDSTTVHRMENVEEKYPQCHAMMGLHPCSVTASFEDELDHVFSAFERRNYIAVGEIGIDLYWDKSHRNEQEDVFIQQVRFAHARKLPIVIHSRESIEIILDILERLALPGLNGVFHCFGGTRAQAQRITDLDFLMGIGGVVTFKKSNLPETLKAVPLERLILETDSPYLTPHPFRGKRNDPSHIPLVAEQLSQIFKLPLAEIAKQTTDNALKLFFPQETP